MKKFECHCEHGSDHQHCTCESVFEPTICALGLYPSWRESDDSGKPSAQLPKLTAKVPVLPEWCTVGALAYFDACDDEAGTPFSFGYGKITAIKGEMVTIDGDYVHLKYLAEARVRPWTLEEIKPLLPLVVAERGDESKFHTVVLAASNKCVWLGSACSGIEYSALLAEFDQLGGAPCGVLEHLENGEWVK